MIPGILGKKIGMTQVFRADGQAVPVTLLKAGPCMVVERKTPAIDGYDAVQLGLVEFVKPARINKPSTGHLKKAGVPGFHSLRRFRTTHLRMQQCPEDLIRFWLGHGSNSVTDRYSKVAEQREWRKEWAEKVGLGFEL